IFDMKKWESALVNPDDNLERAIQVLDRESLRVALVVDNNKRLLGTLTDGDVRRALIKHLPLSTPVKDVMCTRPSVARRDWSPARMLSWMEKHDLLQLPIVDDEWRVVGLETLNGLLQRPQQ